MAIQYAASRINTTFSPTSKQNLIDNIETALLSAGWSTVSGHSTTNLLMQTATTPQSLTGRIRVKDNGNTCVVISIENVSGTCIGTNSTIQGLQLNPGASGSKTFRVLANPYQAFIFTPAPTPAREYAAFGVPYLPSFLVGVITEAMWAGGNTDTDTSTTVRTSFRNELDHCQPTVGNFGNMQVFANGVFWQVGNNSGGSPGSFGSLALVSYMQNAEVVRSFRWFDNSANLVDAVLSWGLSATNVEGKLMGQMWDAAVSSESYNGDLTTTFDSHNWWVVTHLNNGSGGIYQRGTLFIATP